MIGRFEDDTVCKNDNALIQTNSLKCVLFSLIHDVIHDQVALLKPYESHNKLISQQKIFRFINSSI